MAKEIKKRILLIDFYNLFIRNFYVVPVTNSNGEHFGGTIGFLKSLKQAVDKLSPSEVYIISDGPSSSARRKLKHKEYKGNRDRVWKRGAVRAFDFLNEEELKGNYAHQIARLNDYLNILPIKKIEIAYIEADDIIAEIANNYHKDCNIIIYSTDKDYLQLLNNNVFVFNPMNKKIVTKNTFFDDYGMRADNYIYLKIVEGDSSDNIKGIPGIARKTFLKMFPSARDEKIENVPELVEMSQHAVDSKSTAYTKGVINKFNLMMKSEEKLKLNYELMQLSDADISLQSKDIIQKFVEEEKANSFMKMRLKIMFIEDHVEGIIKSVHDWSMIFSKLSVRSKNV